MKRNIRWEVQESRDAIKALLRNPMLDVFDPERQNAAVWLGVLKARECNNYEHVGHTQGINRLRETLMDIVHPDGEPS